MDRWQRIWRTGLAPQLSDYQLHRLKVGLETNDRALTHCGWHVRLVMGQIKMCALCFASELETVEEMESWYRGICQRCEALTGEQCAIRHFAHWWDHQGAMARRLLLEEVVWNLEQRQSEKGRRYEPARNCNQTISNGLPRTEC